MDGVIVRGRIIQDPIVCKLKMQQEITSNQTKDKLALIQPLRLVRISVNGLLAKMIKRLHFPTGSKKYSLEYEDRGMFHTCSAPPPGAKNRLTATIQHSSSLARS